MVKRRSRQIPILEFRVQVLAGTPFLCIIQYVQDITIKYTDLSDPYFPKVQVGYFYVNYRPTHYASTYDRIRGFTADGHPVIIHGLRFDSDTGETFARTVEFLKRPSIFTYNHSDPEPEPEPVQAAVPPPPPPEPEIQYAWPDSYCWRVLGLAREHLPENREVAQELVERQFRERALKTHPDHSGDDQGFRQILAAREDARRILSSLVVA